MRHHTLSLLATFILCPVLAGAMTFHEVDLVCPIGAEKFKQTLAGSGTSFGMYLDTRPFGPTPAPWPLAKCPGNGFVLFADQWTPEELQKLEAVVKSTDYQRLRATETNYFLAAHLMAALGLEHRKIGYALVQASWESKTPEQELRYLQEALTHYKAALESAYENPKFWIHDQLLAGELERRSGQFQPAQHRFTALLSDPRLKEDLHIQIARYQLELIAKADSKPQRVPTPSR